MKVLVAIASYGTGQDHFLQRVIAEYLNLEMECRIVVLSNIPKTVAGAETLVGLPSGDAYSLPFAHRKLFRDNAEGFDLFIYTEDDTLITSVNIRAFLDVQQYLEADEILGFLRSEINPEGRRYIVSANNHFRWCPDTALSRAQHRFAQFSNQHSGCFIATRLQLQRALASGGFTLEPHAESYGMLETAASDIYTQCGFKRLICLTRIRDFIVPHLANKYHGQMGMREADFLAHVRTVSDLVEGKTCASSMFNPETRAPGFRWSKHLYREADEDLISLVPWSARRVLSIGATMGHDEVELQRRGFEVSAMPLDAVFADTLARRGVKICAGHGTQPFTFPVAVDFDVVFAADVLHLTPRPLAFLRSIAGVLSATGVLVASVSNTSNWGWQLRDWRHRRWRWTRPCFERYGAHPVSAGCLRQWCSASGLEAIAIIPRAEDSPALAAIPWLRVRRLLAPTLVLQARRAPSMQSARADRGTAADPMPRAQLGRRLRWLD